MNNINNIKELITIKHKASEIANLLLEKGADVNIGQGLPLYHAVNNENLQIVRALLHRGADVGMEKALYLAVKKQNCDIFKELFCFAITKNIEVDYYHLLTYSVKLRFKCAIFLILEKKLVRWLTSALWAAISWGDLEVIEALLSQEDSDIEPKDALHTAVDKRKWDVAKYLISKGFTGNPNYCLRESIECPELVEFFIKQGAISDCIQSAFQEAVLKRCKRSAEILLEHGAIPTPDLIPHMIEMKVGIFGL